MHITTSIRQLMEQEEFVLRRFYDKFLSRDSRVGELFHGVDLERQAAMLTNALGSVEWYYLTKFPVVRRFLSALGQKHVEIGASKELYPLFRECLLETLAEFHGHEWDEELENQWKEATEQAYEVMFEGSDAPGTV